MKNFLPLSQLLTELMAKAKDVESHFTTKVQYAA